MKNKLNLEKLIKPTLVLALVVGIFFAASSLRDEGKQGSYPGEVGAVEDQEITTEEALEDVNGVRYKRVNVPAMQAEIAIPERFELLYHTDTSFQILDTERNQTSPRMLIRFINDGRNKPEYVRSQNIGFNDSFYEYPMSKGSMKYTMYQPKEELKLVYGDEDVWYREGDFNRVEFDEEKTGTKKGKRLLYGYEGLKGKDILKSDGEGVAMSANVAVHNYFGGIGPSAFQLTVAAPINFEKEAKEMGDFMIRNFKVKQSNTAGGLKRHNSSKLNLPEGAKCAKMNVGIANEAYNCLLSDNPESIYYGMRVFHLKESSPTRSLNDNITLSFEAFNNLANGPAGMKAFSRGTLLVKHSACKVCKEGSSIRVADFIEREPEETMLSEVYSSKLPLEAYILQESAGKDKANYYFVTRDMLRDDLAAGILEGIR